MSQTLVITLTGLAGEAVLLLLVLLSVSFFRNRIVRRRDRQAMRDLVARVSQAKPDRERAIANFLGQRVGLSGEALVQAQAELLRAELVLLQRFADTYGERDAAVAGRFDVELYALLQAYQAWTAGESASVSAGVVPPPDDAPAIEQLQAENARMAEQLQSTMATLNRTLHEYAAMFSGDPGVASPPAGNPVEVGETPNAGLPDTVAGPVDVAAAGPVALPTADVEVLADPPPSAEAADPSDKSPGENPDQAAYADSVAAAADGTGSGEFESGGSGPGGSASGTGEVELVAFDEVDATAADTQSEEELFEMLEAAEKADAAASADIGDAVDEAGADSSEAGPDLMELLDAGDEPLKNRLGG